MSDYVKLDDDPMARMQAKRAAIGEAQDYGGRLISALRALNFRYRYEVWAFFEDAEMQRLLAREYCVPFAAQACHRTSLRLRIGSVRNSTTTSWCCPGYDEVSVKLTVSEGGGKFELFFDESSLLEFTFDAKGMV